MLTLFARRAIQLVVTLLLVSGTVFSLQAPVPSDPLKLAENVQALRPARGQLALDRPVGYVEWIKGVARGDLGESLVTGKPVAELLRESTLPSLQLALVAIGIALAIVLTRRARGPAIAPALVSLLSGLVIVETILGMPGLGKLLDDAAAARDHPVVSAIALFAALGGTGLILLSGVLGAFDRMPRGGPVSPQQTASSGNGALAHLVRGRTMPGLALVLLFLMVALVGPRVAPHDPTAIMLSLPLLPPGAANWLGTDELGRDVLSNLIHGARPALTAGTVSVVIALLIGVPLGLISGYLARRGGVLGAAADALISGTTDAMLAFPILVLAITLAAFFGAGSTTTIVAIGIAATPVFARLTRDHGLAAASGSPIWINLTVQALLCVAAAIIAHAAVAALGHAEQPPTPSWGGMIGLKPALFWQAPWVPLSAGLALVLAALSFSLVATGLKEALGETRAP